MTSKRIAQTNQQQKSEKPQESGILQRATFRSVSEAVSEAGVQSTEYKEALPLGNSTLFRDFSGVPISTTKPQQIMAKRMIEPLGDKYKQEADLLHQNKRGEKVIQRWQSDSLKQEINLERTNSLRGKAILEARQRNISDIDEYSDNQELAEYLTLSEREELKNLGKYEALKKKGLTDTVHHILSRDKLNYLYQYLSPYEKDFFSDIFKRQSGVGGYSGLSDTSRQYALLSLRSNLVLGPKGAKRTDDPNRNSTAKSDFDPNYTSEGQMEQISDIYHNIDTKIEQLKKGEITADQKNDLLNQILNHMLDAELLHAHNQGREGFWNTTIDYDSVEKIWKGEDVGIKGEKWEKKYKSKSGIVAQRMLFLGEEKYETKQEALQFATLFNRDELIKEKSEVLGENIGGFGLDQENKTGLPDNLKVGIKNLSGISMNDVKVHYNSSKPAQLLALAYTQGTDIYVGQGQEKHLPHEAWHVVQQKQGRVKPTMQMKGEAINNDAELEKEADVMGSKVLQEKNSFNQKDIAIHLCNADIKPIQRIPIVQTMPYTYGFDQSTNMTQEQWQKSGQLTLTSIMYETGGGEFLDLGHAKSNQSTTYGKEHAEDVSLRIIANNLGMFQPGGHRNHIILNLTKSPCTTIQRPAPGGGFLPITSDKPVVGCTEELIRLVTQGLTDNHQNQYQFKLTIICRGLYSPRRQGYTHHQVLDASQAAVEALRATGHIVVSGDERPAATENRFGVS
ncbi:eCIS core domain-containing protein [Nostoc sp. PCC 9305]|uniref:eCIS core domain-containing protein n=1 Tax=Nostoc sp. PCC 9305 TaxID=296636 RepID=UPI0039C687FE